MVTIVAFTLIALIAVLLITNKLAGMIDENGQVF